MRNHHLHADLLTIHRPDRSWLARLLRGVVNRFLLLPLGALFALLWANTAPEEYFRFAHANAFWVNEIAMAFFLALIAQELYEALMRGGELSHWHHWGLSVIAAAGGLAGAITAYWFYIDFNGQLMLASAWPVAAAVDLAAGYYVMRLIYPRRTAPVAFVLLLAVIIDAVAMIAVTVAHADLRLHASGLFAVGIAIAAAAVMRMARVRTFVPYVLCAASVWFGFYSLGIHPALAFIPIVPFLPHEVRRREVFAAPPEDDDVHMVENAWNAWAQIALFMFGLVNAGVIVRHVDTGSWAVLFAAIVGRPAGILIAVSLALAAGLTLPRKMRFGDLVVAALATTSGFTFALFLGTAALPAGAVSQQVTLGALATAAGALLTIGVARAIGVGRHQHARGEHGVPSEAHSPAR
ncbi:MAG TPA: Na+/H+ antiporter NhaA [Vicinamibacterales bacterium]